MEDCKRENRTKYIFMEILAVAFLATGGIFVRSCGIDSINCAFYRVLFSIPFIYKFAKKYFSLLSKKDVAILLASGVFFATDITVANVAFKCTSIANVNLLCNLTPLTIIPITYFVFKERIPKFYYVGVAVALVGVVLLISGKTDPTASSYFGDLLGFASSVFYGVYLLICYRMRDRIPGSTILFITEIGSLFTLFIYASIFEGFQIPTNGRDLLLVLGISLCMQTVGQGILMYCQGKVNVNISSVVGLMQPGFAAVYSFLIFSEKLSMMEIGGIIIVIFGIFLVKLQYKEKQA